MHNLVVSLMSIGAIKSNKRRSVPFAEGEAFFTAGIDGFWIRSGFGVGVDEDVHMLLRETYSESFLQFLYTRFNKTFVANKASKESWGIKNFGGVSCAEMADFLRLAEWYYKSTLKDSKFSLEEARFSKL